MAHLSDFFKNIFQSQTQDAGVGTGQAASTNPNNTPTDTTGDTSVAVLHLLMRQRRDASLPYYYYGNAIHEYEVAVWQKGATFTSQMRSQVRSGRENATPWGEWTSQKTFQALAAAWTDARAMLADPHRAGEVNRNGLGHWMWNQLDPTGGRNRNAQPITATEVYRYERPAGIDDGRLAAEVAAGGRLPEGPGAGEVVRQLWGREEPAARAAVLQFAHAAPLTYGSWSHWKWLYKQAEEANDAALLAVMMARLDTAPLTNDASFSWLDQSPRAVTVAYMKRRARRYLRAMARRDPKGYAGLAAYLLALSGRNRDELDIKCQWVSLDTLYGGSHRYEQTAHGRGRYVLRRSHPSLVTVDELAPEAWTERPEHLTSLFQDIELPWQTLEWACALLLRRGLALPAADDRALARYLRAPSPLLVRTACALTIARVDAGAWPSATVVATAFYYATGSQRRRLTAHLATQAALGTPGAWDREFALALCERLAESGTGRFAARQIDCAALLGTRYAAVVPGHILLNAVPALLATGRPEFLPLVRAVVDTLDPEALPRLLAAAASLDPAKRQILAGFLLAGLGGRRLGVDVGRQLVGSADPWVRATGWSLLAMAIDVAEGQADATALWDEVLRADAPEDALAGAVGSVEALRALLRAPAQVEALTEAFRARPALLAALSPDAFALLIKSFPLDVLVALIPLMDEPSWLRLRDRLLVELRQDARLTAFWRAVWAVSPAAVEGQLAARVLDDPLVARTFVEAADAEFLETSTAPFEPLLLAWIAARQEVFARGSRPLLAAALHKLPRVRVWALQRAVAVGLTTPFALRLLESGLPEAIAVAEAHFDALAAGDPDELEVALAICDSPDRTAQAFGRAYIERRRATLPEAELTRRLSEHPDAPMQEVVARRLLRSPELARGLKEFDTSVLRAHDRGRKAKELVKQRLASTPPPALEAQVDTAALLELARGTTPRDREWALAQLARLAMAGESVEGFSVDAVGGI